MRSIVDLIDTSIDRVIARSFLHDFVEFLYDFVPETNGRFVSSLQQWDANATQQYVGERIVVQFNLTMFRMENLMARSKKPSKQFEKIEYEFVRGELNAKQKVEAKKWIDKSAEDYPTFISDMLTSDHKVSMSYDNYNDTFVVSITGKPDNKNNAGRILTGRGKTWYLAMMSALYKHYEHFKGSTWISDADEEQDDFS